MDRPAPDLDTARPGGPGPGDRSDRREVDPLDPAGHPRPWRPVSPRLTWIVVGGVLAWALFLVVAALSAWLVLDTRWPLLAGAAVVVIGAVRAVLAARSVRSWGYTERDEDLLVRHGLFVRRLSIVPYARMQFIDVTAGPLERALGLATVTLHTAAAASDARVPGLPGEEAARLRDRLAALGEARTEGL